MIFNSTYPENLKRLIIKKEIGYIQLGENYSCFDYSKIDNKAAELIKKHEIDISKLKTYPIEVEIDEFGHKEFRLVFYYEILETDKEYNERIEKLKLKDLQESIAEIQRFNGCVRQKKELEELYISLVLRGKYKGLKSDVFESFLAEESIEEQVQAAYRKGLNEGEKKLKEYKNKILGIS